MMNKKIFVSVIIVLSFCCKPVHAQMQMKPPFKTYRVGIFAALHLDSVFNGNSYRYNRNFPRFVTPALDFIQGAQIALDSLPVKNGNIIAHIYDSKSYVDNPDSLIRRHALDSLDLIIGSIKDEEYLLLANFALQKNIPFISATYPNDAGITGNPFLIIVNPTLKAHCEAIYNQILQKHATDRIYLCRKEGSQEDRVEEYFTSINLQGSKPLLEIQTLLFNDSNYTQLMHKLDTNNRNVLIGGSLDESFAFKLANEAAQVKSSYPITLFGMPNWEGFRSWSKKNNMGAFPVYFTSAYYNTQWDTYSKLIKQEYLSRYKGLPSDYTYRGFETTAFSLKLLTSNPFDFINHLNDYENRIFTEFKFKPVINKTTSRPDYFENKHLYFFKIEKGKTSLAW